MIMRLIFILLAVCTASKAISQVVIPDQAQVDTKVELKIYSTDKGVRFPTLSAIQAYSIASPAEGLLIYSTSSDVFEFYNGSDWARVSATPTRASDPADKYEGEYYYNTSDNRLHYWDGSTWVVVGLTGATL